MAVFGVTAVFLLIFNVIIPLRQKETRAAGNTCVWVGTNSTNYSDAGNWTDCGGTAPDATDIIKFSSAATSNLTLTENITVASIQSLSADAFARTFNTGSFDITVNGPLTWQAGTLNGDDADITISGNVDITGGTFLDDTTDLILTGTDTTFNSTQNVFDLTIEKDATINTVTLSADVTVTGNFSLNTGTANGQKATLTADEKKYYIGANSGGGTTEVEMVFTGASQYVVASGGTATDTTTFNGAGGTFYWDGSASVKNVVLTDGTLNIRSGKLTIPNDPANGKISCAAGKTLNLTGASAGQMVILRSDLAGSQWDLDKNATCTVNVAYADIKDANNTDSGSGDISTTNSINSGNNTGFAFATELTVNKWISDVESNWNNAANWSLGHVPTSGESVYFGGHDGNCNLDVATTVTNIISSDYAGTFSAGDSDLTIESGAMWNSGTFDAGSSSMIIKNKLYIYGGDFIASSNTLILDDLTFWSNSFNPAGGTVRFRDYTVHCSINIFSTITFYNLNFYLWDGSRSATINSSAVIVVNGELSRTSGGGVGAGVIDLNGTISTSLANWSAKILIDGDINGDPQTINISDGWVLPRIDLQKGVFNCPEGGSVSIAGLEHSGGTFNHNNGTVTFATYSGGGTINVPATETFNNLTFAFPDCSRTATLATGDILVVNGTLSFGNCSSTNGGTIDLNGDIGSISTSAKGGTTTILVDGAAQVINLEDGWKLPAFELAAGTLNAPETGTVTFLNNFTNSGGTFNGNGATIEMGGNADFSGGTFNASSSTIKLTGLTTSAATWTPGGAIFNNVEISDNGHMGNNYDHIITSGTAVVSGNIIHTDGEMMGGQIDLAGDYIIGALASGGNYNNNPATTIVNFCHESNNQTIDHTSGGAGVHIRIDKAGGTFSISSDVTVTGWTYVNGATSGIDSHTITLGEPGGSDNNGGKIVFVPGSLTYSSIIIDNSGNNGNNYDHVDITGTANLSGSLTLNDGELITGTLLVGGDVVLNTGMNAGSALITLNGTENQTYTLSSGAMPTGTITIDKPSGNATFTGTGTINANVNVAQGNLDFAGGSTYTIAAGKTITVPSGQSLKFAGTSPTNMATVTSTGAWNLANAADSTISAKYTNVAYSNATNPVSAIYSTDSLNNTNWSFDTSTTRTWISDTAKNWNDPTAWDTGVPSATDFAVFNSTHVGDVTLSAHTTVGGIDNSAGYTGNLNTSTSHYQLNVNGDFTWNSGTITANNSTLSLGANVDLTGATYTIGGSTFKLTSTSDLMTYTTGDLPLKHLTIDGVNGGWTAVGNITLTSGNLTMTNGNFDAGSGTLDINDGSLTQNGGYFSTAETANTIERNLTRTAGTLDNEGKTLEFDTTDASDDTVLSSNNTLSGTVIINKSISGSRFTNAAGSTINLGSDPTTTLYENGAGFYNNGTISIPSGIWVINGLGSNRSVLNNSGIINHYGNDWDINSCAINNTGTITYAGIDIAIGDSLTQLGTFDLNGKIVTFNSDYANNTTNVVVTANGELGGTVKLNWTSGKFNITFTIAASTSINLGASPITNTYINSGGIRNYGSINIPSGTWTISNQGSNPTTFVNYGTIDHAGNGWDINNSSLTNEGIIDYSGTNITLGNSLTQNGSFGLDGKTVTLDTDYCVNVSNYTIGGTQPINANIVINRKQLSHKISLTTDVLIGGDLTLSQGTLDPQSYTLSVGGNADLSAGAVTAGTSTIRMTNSTADPKTFNGGTKTFNDIEIAPGPGELTFSGAFSFADMTMSAEGTKPIKFTNGTTYTMTGDQFLTGNGSNLVTVTSTADGSAWTLSKSSGLILSDYISLKDSHASGGAEFYALTNSTLVSNTDGWVLEDGAPDNPTTFTGYETSAKTVEIDSGDWNNDNAPYFEWSGADDRAGSGVDGYYIYFGTDAGSDPTIASGIIEDDTSPHYQTTTSYTLNKAIVTGTTYYFILKTKDNAGYISNSQSYFTYKYDNINPSAPEFVAVDPTGCVTSYNFTFTWPEAVDEVGGSGISNYQYKKGSTGAIHDFSGTELEEEPYQDLDNVLYIRAVDNAGNASVWRTKVYCVTGFITIEDGPTATTAPSSLTVSWRSSRVTSSYVQIYEGDTFVTEQGTDTQTDDHDVKIIGLKSGNSYRYRLSWSDPDGNIGSSSWHEATTTTTPEIRNLEVDVLSPSSIVVSFGTNYLATASIEYGKGVFDNIHTLSGQSNLFTEKIENLEAGTDYLLQVRAETVDGTEFVAGKNFKTLALPAISNISLYSVGSENSYNVRVTWKTNVGTTSSLFFRSVGGSYTEITQMEKKLDHEAVINDLADDLEYQFYLSGYDQFGNQAISDINTFQTPLDSSPPEISDIQAETSNVGLDKKDKAQIAIFWKTDEPAKCLVEYAEGISGDNYLLQTAEDEQSDGSHLAVISDLKPQTPYHFRIVCADKGNNQTISSSQTIISGEVTTSVLNLILKTLNSLFGWIGRLM